MPTKKNQTNIDRIIVFSEREKQKFVSLKSLMGKKRSMYNQTGLNFGLTADGQKIHLYLTDLGSIFIAGNSHSGKTTFLKSIIGNLTFQNTPKRLKFLIATSKPVDYKALSKSQYLLKPITTTPKKLISQLEKLLEEMDRRYKILAEEGFRNIFWYNRESKKPKIEYNVLIIDNYSNLIKSLTNPQRKRLENNFIKLISMGRATGIHLILATQQAHAKTISGIMNVNFSNRLAFRTETKKDSWDILFESGCENLLGKGDAILSYHNNGGVLHRIQTPYISDVELKKLVK